MVTNENAHLYIIQRRSSSGLLTATLNALGARQVALQLDGRNAIAPYDVSVKPPFSNGSVMFPWANRLRDGMWTNQGATYRAAITEEKTNNANHGLLRATVYEVADQTESAITFFTFLEPSDAYPFRLRFAVEYSLTEDGLSVTHRLTNLSEHRAPFGTGTHPFFVIDGVPTEDLLLTVPAETYIRVDERKLPIARESVAGTGQDARVPVRVGDFLTDTDFTDLDRDEQGIARVTLTEPADRATANGARSLQVWLGPDFKHAHIFSMTEYPDGDGMTHGLAIEPVTAGPNALNSGEDLLWVAPGGEWAGTWGVSLLNW